MLVDLTQLVGKSRQFNVPNTAEGATDVPGMNNRNALFTNQDLPERSELVRQGGSWGAQIPTGSAFTYVAAWPTTRAELVLNNADVAGSAGGKTILIDNAWMYNISSMAAAQPMTLLGQLVPAANKIAAATDNAAILRYSLSGQAVTYNGIARLALANTAFALTNLWNVLGSVTQAPTTNLGGALTVNLYGRYHVPPGAAFCLAGVAGTAAGTAIIGVEWHEVQLPTPPR